LAARTTVRAGPKAKRRVSAGVLLPLHLAASMNEGPCSCMAFLGPPATARSRATGICSTVSAGISPLSLEEELKAMLKRANEETQNAKGVGAGKG
jgi:hypothetical protein